MSRKLLALLQNPAIEKIGAAVQNDIVSLNALRRFKACGFVDLQSIVSDYGIEDKSLRKISGIVLGKKVSKAQRLSNWEAKEMTASQMRYAATDAERIAKLLKDGKIPVKGIFSEKTGKSYDATLVMSDDGEKTIYSLDFGKK